MDARASKVRELHRKSLEHDHLAGMYRERRDREIATLYSRGGWSHTTLARVVGCSPELIAKILRQQRRVRSAPDAPREQT